MSNFTPLYFFSPTFIDSLLRSLSVRVHVTVKFSYVEGASDVSSAAH